MATDERRCYTYRVPGRGTIWVVAPTQELAEARLLMECVDRGWTMGPCCLAVEPGSFARSLVDYWVGGD